MDKRERIREGMGMLWFTRDDFQFYNSGAISLRPRVVREILQYLHSQGVYPEIEGEMAEWAKHKWVRFTYCGMNPNEKPCKFLIPLTGVIIEEE